MWVHSLPKQFLTHPQALPMCTPNSVSMDSQLPEFAKWHNTLPQKDNKQGYHTLRHPENLVKNRLGSWDVAAGEMAHQVLAIAAKPENLRLIHGPTHGRKPTPANCPLTSIHMPQHTQTYTHTHTHTYKASKNVIWKLRLFWENLSLIWSKQSFRNNF